MNEGIRTDLKPWITPDGAFAEMTNAFVWRGRIRKRVGSKYTGQGWSTDQEAQLYSRLGIDLSNLIPISLSGGAGVGITDGAGAATGTVPGYVYKVGMKFSIGTEMFTVVAVGTPGVMTTTGASVTHTFDTDTGVYVFAGATPATQILFYPQGNYGAGEVDIAGNALGFVPGNKFKLGQMFSIATIAGPEIMFTVIDDTPGLDNQMSRTDGSVAVATFNVTTGKYDIQGLNLTVAINTPVYFYTGEPVMMIDQYERGPINDQTTFACDTQFIYYYNGSFWDQFNLPIFHGSDSQFFWGCNFVGRLSTLGIPSYYITNFNATQNTLPGANDDYMWKYDGTTWEVFAPYFLPGAGGAINTGPFVTSARLIIGFHGRLLLLNTIEYGGGGAPTFNTHYGNRVRWSHYGLIDAPNAWYEDNNYDALGNKADGASWANAHTEEEIISAEFIKDRLIVYFERSTWELAYTGDPVIPFNWLKINSGLGADATFSKISFDKEVVAIGNTGIHSCTGGNVSRIDDKIPEEISKMRSDNSARKRVQGVRDYFLEVVYWTYPAESATAYTSYYPNKVLVYNYKNQTWAYNDDSITALGYFDQQNELTWANTEYTWANAPFAWNSGLQRADFRQVVGGNQQGYIFIIDPGGAKNAQVLSISALNLNMAGDVESLVIENHNLEFPDFIKLDYCQGVTGVNGKIVQVEAFDRHTVTLTDPITNVVGTYIGGGTAARVSNIHILSKQWNPYVEKGLNVQLSKIDFLVDSTTHGQILVDTMPSYSNLELFTEAQSSGCSLGSNVLETSPYTLVPFEQRQEQFWHPLYFSADGEAVQLAIYMNNDQMKDVSIVESDFVINAIMLYTRPTASRLQ